MKLSCPQGRSGLWDAGGQPSLHRAEPGGHVCWRWKLCGLRLGGFLVSQLSILPGYSLDYR
jgi:hypothetical protein